MGGIRPSRRSSARRISSCPLKSFILALILAGRSLSSTVPTMPPPLLLTNIVLFCPPHSQSSSHDLDPRPSIRCRRP
eukprot:6880610-Pyramimonas_sp.AAC.1